MTCLNESTLASMNRRSCGATGRASGSSGESFPSIAEDRQSVDAAPDWLHARMSTGPQPRSAKPNAAAAFRMSAVEEQSEKAEWSASARQSGRHGSAASAPSSRLTSVRSSAATPSSALQRGALLAPSQLRIAVKEVDKTSERKLVFLIECELDGVIWSVLRKERQVSELHAALTQLMRFVPDSPIAARSWIWGRAAEHSGAVAMRVQDFLRELTATGQWVWDEMAVLRQFLQIPISSEKRQARDLLLNEIRSHKTKDARKRLLGEIRKDDGEAQRNRLSAARGHSSGDDSRYSGGSSDQGSPGLRDQAPATAAAADSASPAQAATPAAAPAAATATAGTTASPRSSPRARSPWSHPEGEGSRFLRGIADTIDSARARTHRSLPVHSLYWPLHLLLAAHYALPTTEYLLVTTDYY